MIRSSLNLFQRKLTRKIVLPRQFCGASCPQDKRGLAVEVLIALGRDCIVAYQIEASATLDALPLGTSIIKRTFLLSSEEVRDAVFSGKSLSYSNRLLCHHGHSLLLTRDYRPMYGRDGEVVGVISTGWSRPAPSIQDYTDLSAIVSALECPELPNQLSVSGPLAGSSLGELSDSPALAQRLRRLLPQQVH
jgi:hypothetical protein